ncbi:MAG TPA: hypothetical protein VLR49_01870 [Ferruginibacter sp.]|nr:hypothetical protein [Ferruginibacter sp.]
MLASLAITIFNIYLSIGDSTTLYYTEGHNLFKLILRDPANIQWLFAEGKDFSKDLIANPWNNGYFGSEANFFIIKLVAVFSFFTFGHYILINLFFSMFAFSGIWRLFRFFYEIYPALHKKLAIAILFLPTVVFWSSGALKDPICMGMLGWMTYCIYAGFYKKISIIKNGVFAVIAIWVLTIVKPYIVFAYLPFFVLYMLLLNIHVIKNAFVKLMVILFIIGVSIGGFILMSDRLQEEMGSFALEKLGESMLTQQTNFINMADRAESSFSLGVEYDGSLGSLIRMAPAAINATLFRPYLWESKKISTLLSSLESLSLMIFSLFVLYKAGIRHFIFTIFKDPMVIFCFFFSVLFALFIGATTLNFGTLVRYKIPCMPFFIIALILINEKSRALKKQPLLIKGAA